MKKLLKLLVTSVIAFSGLVSCNQTPASSEETTSSEQVIEYKQLELNATNLHQLSNVNLYTFGVRENSSHPENLTINAKEGFIWSTGIKNINKIVLNAYMSSTINPQEKLVVYNGNNETGTIVEGTNDLGSNENELIITYEFNGTDEFYLANPSIDEVSLYSLTIYYAGELTTVEEKTFTDNTQLITIEEAVNKGKELAYKGGISEDYYIVEGNVSLLEEKQFSLASENSSIIVYTGIANTNIHLENKIKLKGRIQNYYGTIEIISYELLENQQATYSITLSENCNINGKVEVSKTQCNYGDEVEIKLIPNEGYKVVSYIVNNKTEEIPSELTFTLVIDRSYVFDVKFADENAKTVETIKEIKFTEEEGFSNVSSYSHKTAIEIGSSEESWSVIHSNCTSTYAIEEWSLHLRTYADDVVPSAWMNYDVNNITEISFDAKNKNKTYPLDVYVSSDQGETWTLANSFTLTGTSTSYSIKFDEEYANLRIKFAIQKPEDSNYSKDGQYSIDNIVFKGYKD